MERAEGCPASAPVEAHRHTARLKQVRDVNPLPQRRAEVIICAPAGVISNLSRNDMLGVLGRCSLVVFPSVTMAVGRITTDFSRMPAMNHPLLSSHFDHTLFPAKPLPVRPLKWCMSMATGETI